MSHVSTYICIFHESREVRYQLIYVNKSALLTRATQALDVISHEFFRNVLSHFLHFALKPNGLTSAKEGREARGRRERARERERELIESQSERERNLSLIGQLRRYDMAAIKSYSLP